MTVEKMLKRLGEHGRILIRRSPSGMRWIVTFDEDGGKSITLMRDELADALFAVYDAYVQVLARRVVAAYVG
jgi:hypothetical protein